jgi:plasmid stabilization system protein ParE
MGSYIVSPQADEDIFEVWRYLFERAGSEIANRVESEFYVAFDSLAQNPRLGQQLNVYTHENLDRFRSEELSAGGP